MSQSTRIEIISAAVHSAWFAFSVTALGESGLTWEEAPAWQKDSTRHLVRAYEEMDVSKMSVDYLSGVAHVIWMNDKIRAGWKYGKTKDAAAKTHPSLIPFAELSENEQKKDEVVVRTYLSMRKVLGEP